MAEAEGLHVGDLAKSNFRKTLESETPLGRIAQPEDMREPQFFCV